ncbi:hypothetical protein FJT64_008178 [Amphibalanus amphitrite]|uniref:Uncharacterized protein n=1 Tax=Amphibalanus amphitrite TaxID=1232801 RepID=A0A6A4VRE0_AMPAM|nr:hypothetical protein FJT64_008178 [Amphibalanus amphitrite]
MECKGMGIGTLRGARTRPRVTVYSLRSRAPLGRPHIVTTASDQDREAREELVLAPSPRSTSPLHSGYANGNGNGNGNGFGHDKDIYLANGDSHRPRRSIGSGYGCVRHTFCLLNAGMWLTLWWHRIPGQWLCGSRPTAEEAARVSEGH